jgi:nucleotide-binding universal stress UspA family protein
MRAFRRSQVVGAEVTPPHTPATRRATSSGTVELRHQDGGPILVAVDGRPSGWQALEWAAAEAAARQSSLRIVHAVNSQPVSWDLFGTFSPDQWDADIEAVGAKILSEAACRARAVSTALPITTHLLLGPPAAAVLQEAGADALIVLGRGGTPGLGRSFTTSVSKQIARRAIGPVAIVELFDGSRRGRSAERVVVGFDRTGVPAIALGFAFRAAQRRGVGLTTLQEAPRGTHFDASVRDALKACRDVFPDVDVRQRIPAGPIGRALVAESAGAALVVLASRTHRRLRREPFKSVLSVLRSAQSPVVVVGKLPASERLSANTMPGLHHRFGLRGSPPSHP